VAHAARVPSLKARVPFIADVITDRADTDSDWAKLATCGENNTASVT